jgi:hypothetical protein
MTARRGDNGTAGQREKGRNKGNQTTGIRDGTEQEKETVCRGTIGAACSEKLQREI